MSNENFHERLERIKAGSGQRSAPAPALGTITGRRAQMNLRGTFIACFLLSIGLYLIRVANRNYDSIRDEYGIPAALGMGIGSFALVIYSIILMFRAVRPVGAAASTGATWSYPTSAPQPGVKTSAGARAFFSLFGLGLGALACFFLYVGNAGRQLGVTGQVDAETAKGMATGSVIAAIFLVVLALLMGFIGLFVRRLPMKRVVVFFVLGAMLLYTSFQTLRIHPSNWPAFMAEFTRSFTNQTGL